MNLVKRLRDCDSAKERWKVSKDLLHSAKYEYTRTRVKDQQLCNTFSTFFNTKIEKLKLKILSKLTLLTSSPFQDHPTLDPY